MHPLLLGLYVFLPPLATFLFPSLKTAIIFGHGFLSESVLLVLLGRTLKRLQPAQDRADFAAFFASVLCVGVADTIYNLKIVMQGSAGTILDNLSELLYSGFMFFLLIFLLRRTWKVLFDKKSAAIMAATALVHGVLSFHFILIPFYTRPNTPTLFNIVNSTVYGLLSALVVATIMPYVIRVTRPLDHWFLQSLLLLLVADFAIRYQSAFISETAYSFADPGWSLSISAVLAVVLASKNPRELLEPRSPIATYFSVRCLLTLAICGANVLFLFGILLVNIYTIRNALNLTTVLFLMYAIWIVANVLAMKVSRDFLSISSLMLRSGVDAGGPTPLLKIRVSAVHRRTFLNEADQLIDAYNVLVRKTNELLDAMLEQARKVSMGNLATQVAHDIRSPLTAIENAVSSLTALPEDDRILLRGATNRLKDIANHLLEKHRELSSGKASGNHDTDEAPAVFLLFSITESLVTEKRVQYAAKSGVEIDVALDPSAYGLFARLQLSEYKRLLSNLIDNSVEALGDRGKILLSLAESNGQIEIRVQDNGQGIPPEILAKLGQRGETYGKAGGTGLGLYHARTTIEGWGGTLRIQSEVGKGTEVCVTLPRAAAPAWFVSELQLVSNSSVVVVDDDVGIHGVWQKRFDALGVRERGIQVHHFSTPAELRGWVQSNAKAVRAALFLSDQELLGHQETGLDLIDELEIGQRAILVTSHDDEQKILEVCRKLGVRLIPKVSVGQVPIRICQRERIDAVLIDDDPLVQAIWRTAAKRAQCTCLGFTDPAEFFSAAGGIDRRVPVYIDSCLGQDAQGNELKGEEIAKEIRALGFQRIYLATGLAPQGVEKLAWLTGIRGKEAPFGEPGFAVAER